MAASEISIEIIKRIDKEIIENMLLNLGYKKDNKRDDFHWFDDYVSISGCSVFFGYGTNNKGEEEHRTIITANVSGVKNYNDVQKQVDTIRAFEEKYGGFLYDNKAGDYLGENKYPKLSKTEIACGNAYSTFKKNLLMTSYLIEDADLEELHKYTKIGMPPIFEKEFLRNNLLLPFFVSIMENFLRTFLYRFIETNEEAENLIYKKNGKLPYSTVKELLNRDKTIIDIEIEEYSFQNFNSANKAFVRYVDVDLFKDILSEKVLINDEDNSLISILSEMVESRHKLIHEAELNNYLNKNKMKSYHVALVTLGSTLVNYFKNNRNLRIDLESELFFMPKNIKPQF
ncbi:hypothetical protein [Halobacillus sp. K22]|uniref:hypothetical protein n=1 Tax=Halobacillus sp. K22 TaxID=3457431 RepID=UPI003FCD9291